MHINIHDLSNLTITPTTPWYLENINHPNDIYIYNSPKAEAPATIAQHRRAVVFMVDTMTANCVLGEGRLKCLHVEHLSMLYTFTFINDFLRCVFISLWDLMKGNGD